VSAAERILVVSHGHPAHSVGGAEIASYQQYKELRQQGVEAWYLARSANTQAAHGGTPFSVHSADGREILMHSDMTAADAFKLSQPNKQLVWGAFADLLEQLRPNVVHYHHYYRLGVELLLITKRLCPSAVTVLTLHEYSAICHHSGMMVKRESWMPCENSSPAECHQCYPEYASADFFLRKQYVQTFLEYVDLFVAPSEFLRQRYVAWGLPAERILMLENGQPGRPPVEEQRLTHDLRNRFAFFGQIAPHKGVNVLLDALMLLSSDERRGIQLSIHGTNLDFQPEGFRHAFSERVAALRSEVHLHGAYVHADLPRILQSTDWVIVPSIWWENSPLVIQEAFQLGRPVICSDIGGMAEKVRDGVDGLHFKAGDASALADTIRRVMANPNPLWEQLRAGIISPPAITHVVGRLMEEYSRHAASIETIV